MKVIFIKDLKKQGRINDIKEVSDGYAINYLIKNGYAVKYTKTSSEILDKQMKKKELENSKNVSDANKLKKKIESITLVFKVSSNGGKMFGSISSKQIVSELLKYDISVDKKKVVFLEELSSLGMHKVEIRLYKDVVASLNVNILEK